MSSWKRSEVDRLLELHLAGATVPSIARALERDAMDVKKIVHRLARSKDRIEAYEPFRRHSRIGKPFSENEVALLQAWKKLGVNPKAMAKFLGRKVKELGLDAEELTQMNNLRRIGTGVDICLAYRYLYYCQGITVIPDRLYDELEEEEKEFGAQGQLLNTPGSDNPEDYPPHIRGLAIYLAFKYCDRK